MSDLRAETARALERVARDGHLGRKPTFANPLCICLRPMLPKCITCGAALAEPCEPTASDDFVYGEDFHGPWLHWNRRHIETGRPWLESRTGIRPECPIHGEAAS